MLITIPLISALYKSVKKIIKLYYPSKLAVLTCYEKEFLMFVCVSLVIEIHFANEEPFG